MIKDFLNKQVVVVALRDRYIGKLVEITDDWIKLSNIIKKGLERKTIIKFETIVSIAEF